MRDKFRLKKIQRETKRTRPTHVWKKKDTTMESAEPKVELAINNRCRIMIIRKYRVDGLY